MADITHIPVLVEEIMEMLSPVRDGTYIDATLGGGGHTRELLRHLGSSGVVIGMDRDKDALDAARQSISDNRVRYLHGSFSEMAGNVRTMGCREVDGIVMDIGLSMRQVKDAARGFSFYSDAPLDMRMDRSIPLTASAIVNTWHRMDIEKILREYGEERKASQIAEAIVNERRKGKIDTCTRLASVVEGVCRRRGRIHPATRTFQALRIAVNDELNELSGGLAASMDVLRVGGRLCVLSYHSLEDRIVKRYFISAEKEGSLKRLNKKVILPSRVEVVRNPASRSAKLRGVEKL